MYIHREGYSILSVVFIVVIGILLLMRFAMGIEGSILYSVSLLGSVVFLLFLQFFRNPRPNTQQNIINIIAPADGKVVVIEKVEESEYFKDQRIQVSIFMSPFNVHVNRSPITGNVKYFKYHPGKYLVAWHPKSSTENERTTIVVENKDETAILFRQIAGALAKRIRWYVKEGDAIEQGHEFGFIKFGSRVDVFLPLNANVSVKLGQKTKGGETVIATLS